MQKHKLFVVIATHNRKQYLKKLLKQIKELIIPNDITLSTIVVNDGSNDGTREMLISEFPEVIVIDGRGDWWWTKCMNEGFKKAIELEANYLLILNDDNEIERDYLQILWRNYKKLPSGSILGSASVSINDKDSVDSSGAQNFSRLLYRFVPYFGNGYKIDNNFVGTHETWVLSGRGTLIPGDVFHKIGFFDERLVQYGSDDDFILTAKEMNINVYISFDARVYNYSKLTSKGRDRNLTLMEYISTYFDKYSVNSLFKHWYMYQKHSYKIFAPLYVLYIFITDFLIYFRKN